VCPLNGAAVPASDARPLPGTSDSNTISPDFSLQIWKGGAEQAAEKPYNAVILSAAKDLALSIFKAMRDSSSPLLLRMTPLSGFSAACLALPLQGVLEHSLSRFQPPSHRLKGANFLHCAFHIGHQNNPHAAIITILADLIPFALFAGRVLIETGRTQRGREELDKVATMSSPQERKGGSDLSGDWDQQK